MVSRTKDPAVKSWAPPGGKVESGESIGGAALRELWEETGIRGRLGALVTVVEIHSPVDEFVLFCFRVYPLGSSTQARAGDDAGELRWISFDEIDGAELAPGVYTTLKQVREGACSSALDES